MFSRRSDTTWKRKSIRLHINLGVLRETYIQQKAELVGLLDFERMILVYCTVSKIRYSPPLRRLCVHRCLCLVCLLATLRKKFTTDLHEIFREGWQWAIEQTVKFWWRSGSPSGYRDCLRIRHYWEIQKMVNEHSFILIRQMAALVRRALSEVCSVSVLLISISL